MSDVTVQVTDDPIIVSVSNSPGPAGASSFFKGLATAWPPSSTPTAGWIYTLPDPVPSGTPSGYQAGYGAQWDGVAWVNIGPVRGPAGPAGPQGAAGTAGSPGAAGTNGTNGTNGTAATITVGSVTTGAAGTSASVVNAGTSSAAVLNITIPRGDTGAAGAAGAQGPQGPAGSAGAAGTAATVSVGTVTTGAAGSSASVTNVGTSSAAILNITIPRGDTGAAGSAGAAGSSGVISVTAPLTNSGTSSAAVLGITTGTTASTVCVGNDARLSDARTPTAHTQAATTVSVAGGYTSFTPASLNVEAALSAISGALENKADSSPATTVNLGPIRVGTGLGIASGTLSVSYGSSGITACVGNDARLSDARTPTAHNQAFSTITATPTTLTGYGITDAATSTHTHGNLTNAGAIGSTSGQIVVTTTSGVLTTAATIAAAAVSGLAAVATSGAYADLSGKPTIPNITSGTAAPSGGSSGDIYLRYS